MSSVSGVSKKVRGHSHTAYSPSSPSHTDGGGVYVGTSSSPGYSTIGGREKVANVLAWRRAEKKKEHH